MNDEISPYGNITSIQQLGKLLSQHRKQLQLTQQQLAMFAGVSAKFISSLENGKTTAEIGKMLRVIQYLGLQLHIVPKGFN